MPSIDLLDTDITVKLWTTRKFNSRYEKSSNKKDNKALKFLNRTRFFFLERTHLFSLASQKQRNGIGKVMNELRYVFSSSLIVCSRKPLITDVTRCEVE